MSTHDGGLPYSEVFPENHPSFSSKRDNYVTEQIARLDRYSGDLDSDAQLSILYVCNFLYHTGAFFRSYAYHVGLGGYSGPFTHSPNLIYSIITDNRIDRKESVRVSEGLEILTAMWELHMNPSPEMMVEYFIMVSEVIGVCMEIGVRDFGDLFRKMVQAMANYNLVVVPDHVIGIAEIHEWLTQENCAFMLKLKSSKRLTAFKNAEAISDGIRIMDDQLRQVAIRARQMLDGKGTLNLRDLLSDQRWNADKVAPIPYFYEIDEGLLEGSDCSPERLMVTQSAQSLIANTVFTSGKSPLRMAKPLKQLAQLIFITDAYEDTSCKEMGNAMWKATNLGKPPSVLYNPKWIHTYLQELDRNRHIPVPKPIIRGIISAIKALNLSDRIHQQGEESREATPRARSKDELATKHGAVTKESIFERERLGQADNPGTSESGMILPILLTGVAIYLVMR